MYYNLGSGYEHEHVDFVFLSLGQLANIVLFIAIHFPANFMISFFFLAQQNSIVWLYHIPIICALVGGHPG